MLTKRFLRWGYFGVLFCCLAASRPLFGFSLLGPYAPWMVPDFYYRLELDVGGPMDINEGYRWNVPVITYGFDQGFIDYFGEEGIAAVEQAVATLNDLPPASALDVGSFSLNSKVGNELAAALGLIDLKSAALSALLEQLGLANPYRYMWTIHDRTVDQQGTNYIVIQRNFDPVTLETSPYLNGQLFMYDIISFPYPRLGYVDAIEFSVDAIPLIELNFPLAAHPSYYSPGLFFAGLTRDDVGGLRFLLRESNRQVEQLLPAVTPGPENSNAVVNVALRPGVEKINLLRLPKSDGMFIPLTNVFVDSYFTNGIVAHQQLQRVIKQPDILFRASDLGLRFSFPTNRPPYVTTLLSMSSDASHWQNNAALNGQPMAAGPGVIQPSAEITFNTIGRYANDAFSPAVPQFVQWASFDEDPESIFVFTGHEFATSATVSTRLVTENNQPFFEWRLLVRTNQPYRLESSTDLKEWTPAGSLMATNDNFATFRAPVSGPNRCYRAVLDSAPQ